MTWDTDKWVKTDTDNNNNEWYDYDNQKWANSVLVTTESRDVYKNANIDTEILEEDILAYYVYVPRYKYQLWNADNNQDCLNDRCYTQEIRIEFENKNKEKSLGAQNGEWLTHPAFTFGESELNGIWVGKFATSVDPSTSCYSSPSETNCNNKLHNPRVKPNMDMWRYTRISEIFSISKKVETEPMYGLTTYENADSHLMKNMEWGATAYLTHSKYGKYGNSNFSGSDKQLYINNYRSLEATGYKTETGCSGGAPNTGHSSSSCQYPYPLQKLEVTGASTTGNIYGIYDMSGGVWEYVMGNMVASGYPLGTFHANSSSGTWNYIPLSKYYDSYVYDIDMLTHERGHLGDGTREVLLEFGTNEKGGWCGDRSRLPSSTNVWILRSGVFGSQARVFAFIPGNGFAGHDVGFRMVFVLE